MRLALDNGDYVTIDAYPDQGKVRMVAQNDRVSFIGVWSFKDTELVIKAMQEAVNGGKRTRSDGRKEPAAGHK